MKLQKYLRSVWIGLLMGVAACAASSQTFPTRSVRLIAPVESGSPTDTIARLFAQKLALLWGQSVVVDNRPSVNGVLGAEMVARAPADGYTLLVGNSGTQVVNAGLYRKLSYNPSTDFASVAQLVTSPIVLLGSPHFPPSRVSEVIAAARATPAAVNFAVPGATAQLVTAMFNSVTGVNIVSVPYKGSSGAEIALLSGDAQLLFASTSNALPYARSGRMKVLAVTSPERIPLLPTVPTLSESGLTGFEAEFWVGLFAPAGTPDPALDRVNRDVAQILQTSDVRAKLQELGFTPITRTRPDFDRYVKSSIERYGGLMKKFDIPQL